MMDDGLFDPPQPFTFRRLQHEVGEWSRRNFPNNMPHHPLLGLTEEVGELAHSHLKLEQGIRGTESEHILGKMDAVGDILIYLADYCSRNNIDMQETIEHTWRMVQKRDWQKNRG